jgi:hypothetical protein
MRNLRLIRPVVAGLLVAMTVGCASSHKKKGMITTEPPLIGEGTVVGPGATEIVQAPETHVPTIADRHPLLSRPREYYDTTNGNKLTRTAAATFIGVPSGIGAEVKQLFAGTPAVR